MLTSENILNKIIICSHGSNVSDWIIPWYTAWESNADEIYLLLDNCDDDSLEKAEEISLKNPSFHYFYKKYTSFRFSVIRNDLLSLLPAEKAFYIFPCMDQWPIVANWKDFLKKEIEKLSNLDEPLELILHSKKGSPSVETFKSDVFEENTPDFLVCAYGFPENIFNLGANGCEYRLIQPVNFLQALSPESQWFLHFRKKGAKQESKWSAKEAFLTNFYNVLFGEKPTLGFFTSTLSCFPENLLKRLNINPVDFYRFWLYHLIKYLEENSDFIKDLDISLILQKALFAIKYLKEKGFWPDESFYKSKEEFLKNFIDF